MTRNAIPAAAVTLSILTAATLAILMPAQAQQTTPPPIVAPPPFFTPPKPGSLVRISYYGLVRSNVDRDINDQSVTASPGLSDIAGWVAYADSDHVTIGVFKGPLYYWDVISMSNKIVAKVEVLRDPGQ